MLLPFSVMKSTSSPKLLSHATHSPCILQQGPFLQAMKRNINSLEQMICFQHRCFIQVTDQSLEVPPSRAYLAIPRRTRSAWAELRRKAVLFYLGTVGTKGGKKINYFIYRWKYYRQKSPRQGKSLALIQKAGDNQP